MIEGIGPKSAEKILLAAREALAEVAAPGSAGETVAPEGESTDVE